MSGFVCPVLGADCPYHSPNLTGEGAKKRCDGCGKMSGGLILPDGRRLCPGCFDRCFDAIHGYGAVEAIGRGE